VKSNGVSVKCCVSAPSLHIESTDSRSKRKSKQSGLEVGIAVVHEL